jgi:hypothetical protein
MLPTRSGPDFHPDNPCRNCALTNRVCTYAVRDKKVTIPESYLRRLENELQNSKVVHSNTGRSAEESCAPPPRSVQFIDERKRRRPSVSAVENSTAQLFVSKLKQIQSSTSGLHLFGNHSQTSGPSNGELEEDSVASKYEYFALDSDTARMFYSRCTRSKRELT